MQEPCDVPYFAEVEKCQPAKYILAFFLRLLNIHQNDKMKKTATRGRTHAKKQF